MNAMKNSLSKTGEDGVTMMAGSSAFSSTRGSVRSVTRSQRPGQMRAAMHTASSYVPRGAGISV